MSTNELIGCAEHDIRVFAQAKDAWASIPWSAEKNLIRHMCNYGSVFPLCPAPEIDLFQEPTLVDDPQWSDPNRLPDCLKGSHYPLIPGEISILSVGFWVVLYLASDDSDRSLGGNASLRNATVVDIRFLRDLARVGLGLQF